MTDTTNAAPEPEPGEPPIGLAAQLAAGRAALQASTAPAPKAKRRRRGLSAPTAQAVLDLPAARPGRGPGHPEDRPVSDEPAAMTHQGLPPAVVDPPPAVAESPVRPDCRPARTRDDDTTPTAPRSTPEPMSRNEPRHDEPAPIAGGYERHDVVGGHLPADDVVSLVADLAARARLAEAQAAAAQAELDDLKAAITQHATRAETSAPDDSVHELQPTAVAPSAGRGGRRRWGAALGVVALSAVAVAVWWPGGTATPSALEPTPTVSRSGEPAPTATPTAAPEIETDGGAATDGDDPPTEQQEAPAPPAAAASEDGAAAQAPASQTAPENPAAAARPDSQHAAVDNAPAASAPPARAATQQTVTCTSTATITFTATGGGQVDISAAGQHAAGIGTATTTVAAGSGAVTASANADGTVAITYDWTAAGGTCT